MGLTVFNQFPQLTRLLACIACVAAINHEIVDEKQQQMMALNG